MPVPRAELVVKAPGPTKRQAARAILRVSIPTRRRKVTNRLHCSSEFYPRTQKIRIAVVGQVLGDRLDRPVRPTLADSYRLSTGDHQLQLEPGLRIPGRGDFRPAAFRAETCRPTRQNCRLRLPLRRTFRQMGRRWRSAPLMGVGTMAAAVFFAGSQLGRRACLSDSGNGNFDFAGAVLLPGRGSKPSNRRPASHQIPRCRPELLSKSSSKSCPKEPATVADRPRRL